MTFYWALLLVSTLVASTFAQAASLMSTGESAGQAPGLQILEAHARATKTSDSKRARLFTIVVKNTGEQGIKSLGFTFENVDDGDTPETEKNPDSLICGFVITDLDIQPDSVFTIEREMTGSHCVPEASVEQRVRVQEVLHSDGSTWRPLQYDRFGWKRVDLVRSASSSP